MKPNYSLNAPLINAPLINAPLQTPTLRQEEEKPIKRHAITNPNPNHIIYWFQDPYLLSDHIMKQGKNILILGRKKSSSQVRAQITSFLDDLLSRHTGASNGIVFASSFSILLLARMHWDLMDYFYDLQKKRNIPLAPSGFILLLNALDRIGREQEFQGKKNGKEVKGLADAENIKDGKEVKGLADANSTERKIVLDWDTKRRFEVALQEWNSLFFKSTMKTNPLINSLDGIDDLKSITADFKSTGNTALKSIGNNALNSINTTKKTTGMKSTETSGMKSTETTGMKSTETTGMKSMETSGMKSTETTQVPLKCANSMLYFLYQLPSQQSVPTSSNAQLFPLSLLQSIYQSVEVRNRDSHLLTTFLNCCNKHIYLNTFKMASSAWREYKKRGEPIDQVALSAMIRLLTLYDSKFRRAKKLNRERKEIWTMGHTMAEECFGFQSESGITPSTASMSVLTNFCQQMGKVEVGEGWLKCAQSRGCVMDMGLRKARAYMYFGAEMYEMAFELCKAELDAKVSVIMDPYGWRPLMSRILFDAAHSQKDHDWVLEACQEHHSILMGANSFRIASDVFAVYAKYEKRNLAVRMILDYEDLLFAGPVKKLYDVPLNRKAPSKKTFKNQNRNKNPIYHEDIGFVVLHSKRMLEVLNAALLDTNSSSPHDELLERYLTIRNALGDEGRNVLERG